MKRTTRTFSSDGASRAPWRGREPEELNFEGGEICLASSELRARLGRAVSFTVVHSCDARLLVL